MELPPGRSHRPQKWSPKQQQASAHTTSRCKSRKKQMGVAGEVCPHEMDLEARSCKIPFSNSPHLRTPSQKLAGSPAAPWASAQKQRLEDRRRLTPAPTKPTGHGRSLRAGGATNLCWPVSTKPIDALTRGARLFCAHVAQRDGRRRRPRMPGISMFPGIRRARKPRAKTA